MIDLFKEDAEVEINKKTTLADELKDNSQTDIDFIVNSNTSIIKVQKSDSNEDHI